MEDASTDNPPGKSRVLGALACIVIVIGGLKVAAPLLIPIMVAFFLSVLSLPILRVLRKWGLPRFPAVLATIAVDIAIISPIALVSFNLANQLQTKVKGADGEDGYEQRITNKIDGWISDLEERDIKIEMDQDKINEYIEDGAKKLLGVLGKTLSIMKDLVFIIIVMIFFLSEAGGFKRKMNAIHLARGPDLARFQKTAQDIQKYLGIKTAISFITGLLAAGVTWAVGLELPVLWGLVAFIFNFIPAIGSIIASFPPTILALIDKSPTTALFVLLGYLAINMVLGNFVEPMLMGQRFGVSTSVVILSVLFWGWAWGLVGMFLAVPLTMMVKVMLDNSEELRWLSVAMGKRDDPTTVDLVGESPDPDPGAAPSA